jgi:hypothetical protein
VALYLHRGAFEPLLADEDAEQDPDRWCSHAPAGQEAWQIVSQWIWNLRLELGHLVSPTPLRTTEFAPAIAEASEREASSFGYASPEAGVPWKAGRFSGRDFVPQVDGTLRCPAGKSLHPTEQRREADGTLRVHFAAKIRDCRSCHLREHCQWHGTTTKKPRRVSLLLHPLSIGKDPVLWKDWSRRQHRRVAIQLCRSQQVEVQIEQAREVDPAASPSTLSRAQRAHYRLSWQERLARNIRPPGASQVRIKLFGIPEGFAALLDSGYITAPILVSSQQQYGIEVLGPARGDVKWQATTEQGIDVSQFRLDWDQQQVTCPQGHTSMSWTPAIDHRKNEVIKIKFSTTDCGICPELSRCTRSAKKYKRRTITLRPQAQHEALQAARRRQQTPAFASQYALREGIEATISEASACLWYAPLPLYRPG